MYGFLHATPPAGWECKCVKHRESELFDFSEIVYIKASRLTHEASGHLASVDEPGW
jgi:hypothetical protein